MIYLMAPSVAKATERRIVEVLMWIKTWKNVKWRGP